MSTDQEPTAGYGGWLAYRGARLSKLHQLYQCAYNVK